MVLRAFASCLHSLWPFCQLCGGYLWLLGLTVCLCGESKIMAKLSQKGAPEPPHLDDSVRHYCKGYLKIYFILLWHVNNSVFIYVFLIRITRTDGWWSRGKKGMASSLSCSAWHCTAIYEGDTDSTALVDTWGWTNFPEQNFGGISKVQGPQWPLLGMEYCTAVLLFLWLCWLLQELHGNSI